MTEKIKYLHVMPHMSVLYNRQFITMINENKDYFDANEHLFIVANDEVIKGFKNYQNVVLEKDITIDSNILSRYIDSCKFVFLHENLTISVKTMLKLGKKRLKKIIWCVWGHDLYPEYKGNLAKRLKEYVSRQIRKRISANFYAVGVGFEYDKIQVQKDYRGVKIVNCPYGYEKGLKCKIDSIISSFSKDTNMTRVMIGHSSYPFLNHIETLNKLARFKDNAILVSLVLSYGNIDYGRRVEEHAIKIFGNKKVEVIRDLKTWEKYTEYLSSVDVCIFNFKKQAALGNFYTLCYMGKKLFLKSDGILDIAAKSEGMKTYEISDIENMTFEEFSKPVLDNDAEKKFGKHYIDERNYLKTWKKTLDSLKDDGC